MLGCIIVEEDGQGPFLGRSRHFVLDKGLLVCLALANLATNLQPVPFAAGWPALLVLNQEPNHCRLCPEDKPVTHLRRRVHVTQLHLRDKQAITGIDHVWIGALSLDFGVFRMVVDLTPVRDAILRRDAGEALPLLNPVIVYHRLFPVDTKIHYILASYTNSPVPVTYKKVAMQDLTPSSPVHPPAEDLLFVPVSGSVAHEINPGHFHPSLRGVSFSYLTFLRLSTLHYCLSPEASQPFEFLANPHF